MGKPAAKGLDRSRDDIQAAAAIAVIVIVAVVIADCLEVFKGSWLKPPLHLPC